MFYPNRNWLFFVILYGIECQIIFLEIDKCLEIVIVLILFFRTWHSIKVFTHLCFIFHVNLSAHQKNNCSIGKYQRNEIESQFVNKYSEGVTFCIDLFLFLISMTFWCCCFVVVFSALIQFWSINILS